MNWKLSADFFTFITGANGEPGTKPNIKRQVGLLFQSASYLIDLLPGNVGFDSKYNLRNNDEN